MQGGQTDPDYLYTPAEKRLLARNLASIYSALDSGAYATQTYNPRLFCHWHRKLFDGVRDHAGIHRSPAFGPETLTFGPNRSAHRDEVPGLLHEHSRRADDLIRQASLRSGAGNISFVAEAIEVAAYVHADLIRIHPFIDGNGRVGRVAMDWILGELAFPLCIAFHVPAVEYKASLNHFYRSRDIQPLVDLVLRAFSFALR